jgi:hypothetical protein
MFPGIDLMQAAPSDNRRNHYPATYGRAFAPNRRLNVQLKKTTLNENASVRDRTLHRCQSRAHKLFPKIGDSTDECLEFYMRCLAARKFINFGLFT